MATAKQDTVIVKVTKEEKQRVVHLTLSAEEAEVLLAIVRRVGGPPAGPRRHVDQIVDALRQAKVDPREFGFAHRSDGPWVGGGGYASLYINTAPKNPLLYDNPFRYTYPTDSIKSAMGL